jgi:hypothetical protein
MADNEQDQPKGPQENPEEKPKIIVDDDWKAQAKAEKEKLAKEVEGEGAPRGGRAGQPRELPPASFTTLVSSIVTQAFLSLGGMQDRSGRRYVDLDLAKHHIDTLAMLEEKTKGNLADEEKKLLDQGLYECRMQYVNITQRITSMPAAGARPAPKAKE